MIRIPPAEYQALRRHGEEEYPHESCGVLVGSARGDERLVAGVVPCRNLRADSPRNRYHIDPRDLLRIQREVDAQGKEVVGFYHSHPDHPALPSATDLAEAHWPGCSYVITRVAAGRAEETRSFLLEGDGEAAKRFRDEDLQVRAPAAAAADPSGAP